ncbi:hypothetical protein I352_01587 [Cryptococcus deuterogattii MMRL2647]|nr:hypothetical protein I352_01587 [Cryptococcus deuterogattii MMRL2647]
MTRMTILPLLLRVRYVSRPRSLLLPLQPLLLAIAVTSVKRASLPIPQLHHPHPCPSPFPPLPDLPRHPHGPLRKPKHHARPLSTRT